MMSLSLLDHIRRPSYLTLFVGGITLAGASQVQALGVLADTVPGISSVTKVAATTTTTVFLKSDGTVWQVGDFNCTPTQVSGLSNVTDIAAGSTHAVARRSDGTVWAWGGNFYGQLGNCTTTDSATPVQVRASCATTTYVTSATSVGAGGFHSLAVISDGTGRAWGRNNHGQLGDGSTTDRSFTVTITEAGTGSTVTGITQLAGGGYHSVALRANNNGKVKAWGRGTSGELGDHNCTSSTRAVDMVDSAFVVFTGAVHVSAGVNFSVVTTGSNRVWTTGYNGNGQLGLGSSVLSSCYLQRIGSGFTSVKLAATGSMSEYALAVKTDGSVWSWGRNDHGQLGDGTNTTAYTPVTVKDTNSNPLTGFQQTEDSLAGSVLHSMAANATFPHAGEAWGWGDNIYCPLGNR